MAFKNEIFPTEISYGSAGGPGFNTQIIASAGGQEERISRWDRPRRRYDVSFGIKTADQLDDVRDFYTAVGKGSLNAFRFKDWHDYSTGGNKADIGIVGAVAPAFDDVVLGTGDGTKTDFQLLQQYDFGSESLTVKITKPVSGTVKVGKAGVEQSSGFTVDTTTGIVSFSTAPTMGEQITAGCNFHVPVRFDASVDDWLRIGRDDFNSGSISSIILIEDLDDTPIVDDFNFGGADERNISADIVLSELDGRVWVLDPQSAGLNVDLPDRTVRPGGGPYFYIFNASGSNSFTLRDDDGNTLTTVAAGEGIMAVLMKEQGGGSSFWLAM